MKMPLLRPLRSMAVLASALLLSACAFSLLPPAPVAAPVADAWQAPLPHQGTVGALSQWWQQQGDPLLVELIEAAQAASPTVAQALARMDEARARQAQAYGALVPNLNAQASAVRGVSQPGVPLATTLQGGLQASWELDLVGANRAANQAAQAQVQGSQAQWHDARVSVAADVASLYYALETCQQLRALAQREEASQRASAQLSEVSRRAGLSSASQAAQAQANAAESHNRLTLQSTQCELQTKALVALTALPEPELRRRLAAAPAHPPTVPLGLAGVPAQTVTQRPDVVAAERAVVVAAASVGSAKAQRYPRLTLNGAIGAMRLSSGGQDQDATTWSFGPLALSLPLWDGGQRAAQVKASETAYQASISAYRATVRQAVREVEEALVNLHSMGLRSQDAAQALRQQEHALAASDTRLAQGLASQLEREESQRQVLSAAAAEASVQLQGRLAWVALYRALGGGFEPLASATPTP